MTDIQTHGTDAFQRSKNFGLKYASKFPVGSAGHGALLTAARQFLKDATPMKAQFLTLNLPADFRRRTKNDTALVWLVRVRQDVHAPARRRWRNWCGRG